MMVKLDELVASIAGLRREDLERWIGEEMVRPAQSEAEGESEGEGERMFGDAECARVRLICTLRYDMEIEEGTLPLVLDLIDRLHETHHRLRALGNAVLAQDEATRRAVLARLKGGDLG